MPAQQQHHVTSAYLSSGSVAVGQCVVLDADGVGYVLASAANRTSAGRRSAGIAISAGDPTNTAFEMQVVGQIPADISGLGDGTASSIRVSDAGVLERASFDSDDDVCGRCDEDGTAYVCFPLIGLAAAFGSFTLPTPNYGIIYRGTDGLPKTATGASIDPTGAYIETRSASESVHSTAHWRVGWISATLLGFLDDVGTDRNLIGLSTASGPIFGSSAKQTSIFGSVFTLVTSGGATYTSSLHSFSCGGERVRIDSATNYCGVPRYGLNTAWGASEGEVTLGNTGTYSLTNAQYSYASIVLSGAATGTYTFPAPTAAKSYFKFLQETGGYDKVITIGSGTTYTLKADTSMWLKFTDLGVFAPTVGGSTHQRPTKIVTGTGDLGTIDLNVGGELAETIIFVGDTGTPGDVDVRGFTAPPSGESRRIVIISALAGESTTLTLQDTAADDTDDYMYLPTTTVAIANDGRRGYGLVYNENFPGWVLEGAP